MQAIRVLLHRTRSRYVARQLSTARTSVDDPSLSRTTPPPARTAPSQVNSSAGEEVNLGSSELLLDTPEKVCLAATRQWLSTGFGYPRPQIYGWSWSQGSYW